MYTDFCRECLNQIRGNRAVYHGHVDHLYEDQQNEHGNVWIRRLFGRNQFIRVCGIARQGCKVHAWSLDFASIST